MLRREQRRGRAGSLRGAPLRQLAAPHHPGPAGAYVPGRPAAPGSGGAPSPGGWTSKLRWCPSACPKPGDSWKWPCRCRHGPRWRATPGRSGVGTTKPSPDAATTAVGPQATTRRSEAVVLEEWKGIYLEDSEPEAAAADEWIRCGCGNGLFRIQGDLLVLRWSPRGGEHGELSLLASAAWQIR